MRSNIVILTEIEDETTEELNVASCSRCGGDKLRQMVTRSAFWDNDRLVIIEDVPAVVCMGCHEQHYSDDTVVRLDLLRGSGFPAESAVRHVAVPVFSLLSDSEGKEVA